MHGDYLRYILDSVAYNNGGGIFLSNHELSELPTTLVNAMKLEKILTKAPPAQSVVCTGCEEACSRPLQSFGLGDKLKSYVHCDKRDDTNLVPIHKNHIEQWKVSGLSIASFLSTILNLPSAPVQNPHKSGWELGVLKGKKHASHVLIIIDKVLILSVAGHRIPLDEVFSFCNGKIQIDRNRIILAVNNPALGGLGSESVEERRDRLQKRVNELKTQGVKGFNKQASQEEGITVTRLQQILKPSKKKTNHWPKI